MSQKIHIFNIAIDNLTMEGVLARIDALIVRGRPAYICTANANHIRLLEKDALFCKIYREADVVTADGMFIFWSARLLGCPLSQKVSGSDLAVEICKHSAARGYRIFMLGAQKEIALKAKVRCEKLYPGISVVGYYSPARSEILDDYQSHQIVERINASGANILFVAFAVPLQEKWVARHLPQLRVAVSVCMGGGIDYLAQEITRPPLWVRSIGMEWFARLIQNPRRYLKRYAQDSIIVYYLLRELLRTVLKNH